MTTTKSPTQQAEAVARRPPANQGPQLLGTWDKWVLGAATGYLALEGYDRLIAMLNARNARRNAMERVNRINFNPSSRSRRGEL